MSIRLIRRRSKACISIKDNTQLKWYVGKKYPTDILVNYGFSGKKLESFYRKYPSAKNIPTLNKTICSSKYKMICIAKENGILVPESKLTLSSKDKPSDYIEKRFNSIGGIGIKKAKSKSRMSGKYYQRMIKDRLFEIRVHAFSWLDDWKIQKRMGDKDTIAWNFHNGGKFINVRNPKRYKIFLDAIEISKKILSISRMSFGAVDFIVDSNNNIYFLEINSAPGFTEFSSNIYFDAFNKLCSMNKDEIRRIIG